MSAQRLVHLRRLATRVPFDGRYGPTGKGKKEWQGVYALLVVFGLSLGAHYYYVFSPALDGSSKYKEIQEENRKQLDPSKLRPEGFPAWTDPFKPKPKPADS